MREIRSALVLGGAGFLGRALCRILADDGVSVTVVDRSLRDLGNGAPDGLLIGADVEEADLGAIVEAREPDVVFHLAGAASVPPSLEHPLDDLGRNAGATLTVLERLRALTAPPLLVFTSSAAVYGNAQEIPIGESHPLEPLSPYGVSKLAAEHYVRLYVGLHGISSIVVRPFSLYGPGQRKLVVHDLIARLRGGEDPLKVAAAPGITRDFVYVDDAAAALLALARAAPAEGEAYNLASGSETSLQTLVETICEACGATQPPQFTGTMRPGDPLRWLGDPTRACALGASFDTPLPEGLRQTVAWYDSVCVPSRA